MIHEYGVFIPGAATPDERSIDGLSRAAELSRIDAQMLLASPLPKRVRSEPTSTLAAERVRILREAGFDAFVVTREALRRVKPLRTKSFRFDGESVRFEPAASFEPGGLRLIVHGEIRTRSRVVRTVHQPNPYVEGAPRTERTTEDRRSSDERFLHLYGEGHDQVVEIRPQSFNFRGLGADFGLALSGNVATFLERLQAMFPEARYDDTLRRHPPMPDEQESTGNEERSIHKEGNEEAAMRTSTLIALDILRK